MEILFGTIHDDGVMLYVSGDKLTLETPYESTEFDDTTLNRLTLLEKAQRISFGFRKEQYAKSCETTQFFSTKNHSFQHPELLVATINYLDLIKHHECSIEDPGNFVMLCDSLGFLIDSLVKPR